MGRRPKGKDTATRSASQEKQQTSMSSFFSPQVAPLFEKPQARKREAATASASQSETVTILDDDEAGAAADNDVGRDTEDEYVTEPESDGGKGEPQSSTVRRQSLQRQRR